MENRSNEDEFEPVREEAQLLRGVRQYLIEHPQQGPPSQREALSELERLRAQLANAKEEDKGAILQQYDQVANLVKQLGRERDKPVVDPDSPYFAHLGLNDKRGYRDLFLGRATRLDGPIRIVDWRNAPISGVFYRYREGEEFEEAIGDIVLEGRIKARRTVRIARGQLLRVDAAQGSWVRIDDEWTQVLNRAPQLEGGTGSSFRAYDSPTAAQARLMGGQALRADKRLPEIAALIDPEQFELITRPGSGIVALRGSAGSGKTTVALHRIAYLAFADAKRFGPNRMLFIVWGKALQSYVSHVLPSLGVEGVNVVTWSDWARRQRKRHFSRLPRDSRDDTSAALSKLKLHPALPDILAQRVSDRPAQPTQIEAIDDFVSFLADGEAVMTAVDDLAPGDFAPGERQKVIRQMADQASLLRRKLEGETLDEPILDDEDDAVLLFLWQRRVGALRASGHRLLKYAHIAVDEVQDFSPIEVRVVLDCLDEQRCATLAGDTWQHVVEGTGFVDWTAFFADVGLQGTFVETLQISYRSTAQITHFARQLLGPEAEAEPPPRTTREGPPVELFRFTDHGACVAFLADALTELLTNEPLANVVLIAPNMSMARLYFDGLKRAEVPRLSLVGAQDFSFLPGVEVADIADVKGLEFDYVVVLEASAQHYADNALARRQLHVGASRASHQLWVTSVDTPAAAIRALLA